MQSFILKFGFVLMRRCMMTLRTGRSIFMPNADAIEVCRRPLLPTPIYPVTPIRLAQALVFHSTFNFQQLYFYGEYAVVPKISVFTQIPIRWLQAKGAQASPVGFSSHAGFGDMNFGVKYAPWSSPTHSLTFRFLLNAPTGDARNGLGTNHVSIEPSLLYYQQLSSRMALEAEVGDTHPLSSSRANPVTSSYGFAGDVFYYGVGPSYQFVRDEQFRLAGVLELVAWNVRSGQATTRGNTYGVNIVNLKAGPRMAFGDHHSVYVGYGIALTSQTWYREIFRTEYRYSF